MRALVVLIVLVFAVAAENATTPFVMDDLVTVLVSYADSPIRVTFAEDIVIAANHIVWHDVEFVGNHTRIVLRAKHTLSVTRCSFRDLIIDAASTDVHVVFIANAFTNSTLVLNACVGGSVAANRGATFELHGERCPSPTRAS